VVEALLQGGAAASLGNVDVWRWGSCEARCCQVKTNGEQKVLPDKVKVVQLLQQGRFDTPRTALPALGRACLLLGLITTRQKAQHTAIADAIAVTITATCVEHVFTEGTFLTCQLNQVEVKH
jgi:hypothetical protein